MAMNTVPTLYELYTEGGISHGLSVSQPHFTLNNKNITIYGGAMHYFRVPREYWRDRLRKMRAAGLNTVDTYVPWNLHEPQVGNYDFGQGDNDLSQFLDVATFLRIAQEEDLLAIVRPGPYICAEWEFGGLPSWLLREDDIKIRTSDEKFMRHVSRFFGVLLQLLSVLQFTNGGPIVAFQVENEYGSTEWSRFRPDKAYVQKLVDLFGQNGIRELLLTSDSPLQHGDSGTLPGLFQTANFWDRSEEEFRALDKYQRDRPTMAMEFWSGWFDHWAEDHNVRSVEAFGDRLEKILRYPASVSLYMFQGGTNWGFMNGANIGSNRTARPDVTSYDYDAPLSESGDYTAKYYLVQELIARYNKVETKLPVAPKETPKTKYGKIEIIERVTLDDLLDTLSAHNSTTLRTMETLPINNNSGQSYGYVIYRKHITEKCSGTPCTLRIEGQVHDVAMVLLDGELITSPLLSRRDLNSFGHWLSDEKELRFTTTTSGGASYLDLVVLNMGRNNFGRLEQFNQFKGIDGRVFLNDRELLGWTTYPLEFKRKWVNNNSLAGWREMGRAKACLSLYRAELVIEKSPQDTFIDMSDWTMGIVVVNGFTLGRYLHLGPQQTLYLPAPLLRQGRNELLVFEHFGAAGYVTFSDKPIYFTKK